MQTRGQEKKQTHKPTKHKHTKHIQTFRVKENYSKN